MGKRTETFLDGLVEVLRAGGCPEPGRRARRILDASIGPDGRINAKRASDFARQFVQGVPLSRLEGVRGFWKHDFLITPATLDPRPESETLVEAALELFKTQPPQTILDLGTGSGCLLVSLLDAFPSATGLGLDLSVQALRTARRNRKWLQKPERMRLVAGDWFAPLTGRWDLIVSNPPYVSDRDYARLEPNVRDFDPPLALRGGVDGMDPLRRISCAIGNHLEPHGAFLVEIGYDQAREARRILVEKGLSIASSYRDLAGHERVLHVRAS